MMLNKLRAILRATALQDINIFNFKKGNEKVGLGKKIGFGILSIWLIAMLLFTMGFYAYMLAEPLSKVGLTYVILALFYIVTVMFMLIGGINKSQGVLFTSKDSNMLLSMPIKKGIIFTARFIKLLLFEYIWSFLIMVPTIAVYSYFEHPDISFYIVSLIMIIILPIIPMLIASIIGYVIQLLSSRVKRKNTARIIYNIIFTFGFLYIVYSLESYIPKIVKNATSIADILGKIYYPLKIYISNLQSINILELLIYVVANIGLVIVFASIFSKGYFKLLSKLSERHTNSNYKVKNLKSTSISKALFNKEVKRFFSSSIYVMNTLFGVVLFVIAGVFTLIKGEQGVNMILTEMAEGNPVDVGGLFSKAVLLIAGFCISTTAITASAISIEGKTLWLTKSLPVDTKKIFNAKLLNNIIMVLPAMLVSIVLFAIGLKMGVLDILMCVVFCTAFTVFESIFGLLVNLKFPKLNASNDTVIVKQSLSSFLGIFGPLALVFIPLIIMGFANITNVTVYAWTCIGIIAVLDIILFIVLRKYGTKRLYQIN